MRPHLRPGEAGGKHPRSPREVIAEYVAAMRAGEYERGFAFFADDVVAHVPGRSPLAGVHEGRGAVVACLRTAIASSHGKATVELIDVLVGAEYVALVVRERLVDGDGTLDMRRANVYRVRGGEISELWIFEHDQYAVDHWFAAR